MAHFRPFLLLLLTALAVLLTSGADRAYAEEDDAIRLRPGDRIAIIVPGEAAFAQPFLLDEYGNIRLPEVGEINLVGATVEDARDTVLEKLSVVYKDLSRFDVRLVERRLLIRVLGYVKTPGYVNLPETANIQSAIQSAGGLLQGAQLDRVQLRRNGEAIAFNYKTYLDTGDLDILPQLQPEDVVFVPASPLLGNVQVNFDARTLTAAGDAADDGSAVRVFGEVAKPGSFAFNSGQSIVDVIMRAGGVTRYAGVEKIRVINGADPFLFNLKSYLDTGDINLLPEIAPGAVVYVPISVEEVKAGGKTVYVMGEVANPGAFEMTDGATFFDVLANAGGPNRYAETRQLRIIRPDGTVAPFNLAGYTEGRATDPVPEIKPGDAIFVPEKTDQLEKSWLKISPDRAIKIIGSVHKPGRYEWSDEMSLLDLIAHAGGPTREADTASVQIIDNSGENADPEIFNLERFLAEGGRLAEIPRLGAGYTVFLPELPRDPSDNKSQWVRQSSDRSIYIVGAVGSPGRYAFSEDLSFLDILSAADGPRTEADLSAIRVSHLDGAGARVSKIDLALFFETGDVSLLPAVTPGDIIYVPSRSRKWTEIPQETTVRVLGAVNRPGRYAYRDDMTILDLLAEAGGARRDALNRKILVIHAVTGETSAQRFNLVKFAKTGNYELLPVVRAGDTIFVPSKDQGTRAVLLSALRDIVSVVSVAALAAAL
ncbi:MAG: SLBB domain-containing protein [Pseudomonadota bacterium]